MDSQQTNEVIPITNEEERQLRRVFELLSNFHRKKRIEEEIGHIRKKYYLKTYSVHELMEIKSLQAWTLILRDAVMSSPDIVRIEQLYEDMQIIKKEASLFKPISVKDVMSMLRTLNMRIHPREVEEMVWEVDEDLDNALGWAEFRLMFTRNITDKTGLEPARMFYLTQFLIYDDNVNGKVSLDETMHMLYTRFVTKTCTVGFIYLPIMSRYGRRALETKLKEIFGSHINQPGIEGGDITFQDYIRAMERVQLQMFHGTAKGRLALDEQF